MNIHLHNMYGWIWIYSTMVPVTNDHHGSDACGHIRQVVVFYHCKHVIIMPHYLAAILFQHVYKMMLIQIIHYILE